MNPVDHVAELTGGALRRQAEPCRQEDALDLREERQRIAHRKERGGVDQHHIVGSPQLVQHAAHTV